MGEGPAECSRAFKQNQSLDMYEGEVEFIPQSFWSK